MKQQVKKEADNSLWNTVGNLCFLILLTVAGVTLSIFVSFWGNGMSWMPSFSKTCAVAATCMLLLAVIIFALTRRPIDALRHAFAAVVMGAVAMPLMTGVCFNMLRNPTDPKLDAVTGFIKGGMYLSGIVCLIGMVMVFNAFVTHRPVSKKHHARR